ncbi:DUF4157 domain-containing protein [Halovivax cerinus]|uniref:DUF4157 domain-containing protein n=1 Tax=Halovivax cerinus TaxID=1487865 RepID=A0ABD5NNT9_9EURY|nr:DUF4157 domain-containing protein [Halovivax cerinus]
MAPGPIGVPVIGAGQQTRDEPVSLGPAASKRASELIAEFQNRPDEIPIDNNRQNLASLQRNMDAHEATGPAGDAGVPDSVRDVISSSGHSLDASIQRAMEDRMGDSFSDVRIHTGPTAANACEAINARAFTVGNHIAFNAGEYDSESPEGQHLLAHELAHVRQQTGGALSMMPQANVELEIDPDPQLEREAEETAQRVMDGCELGIQRLSGAEVHVQRFPWDQSNLDAFDEGGYDNEEDEGLGHPIKNCAARFGTAKRKDYRKTFFEYYPHLKGEVEVHHAVEQQTLRRYPDVVSEAEIHSLENLRGIPNQKRGQLHRGKIRQEWDLFYKKMDSRDEEVTKKKLLDKATEIDNEYREEFVPAVR